MARRSGLAAWPRAAGRGSRAPRALYPLPARPAPAPRAHVAGSGRWRARLRLSHPGRAWPAAAPLAGEVPVPLAGWAVWGLKLRQ